MSQDRIPLSQVCQKAGISQQQARRYLAEYNPARAFRGHHYIDSQNEPEVLALIASKRQRRCRNAFNSSLIPQEVT